MNYIRKFAIKLPKSHASILNNFATTADFGQKGGKVKKTTKTAKKKGKVWKDPYESGPNYYIQESDIGGKGGRASRWSIREFETDEDVVKEER
jgi:hypothetical protein